MSELSKFVYGGLLLIAFVRLAVAYNAWAVAVWSAALEVSDDERVV